MPAEYYTRPLPTYPSLSSTLRLDPQDPTHQPLHNFFHTQCCIHLTIVEMCVWVLTSLYHKHIYTHAHTEVQQTVSFSSSLGYTRSHTSLFVVRCTAATPQASKSCVLLSVYQQCGIAGPPSLDMTLQVYT